MILLQLPVDLHICVFCIMLGYDNCILVVLRAWAWPRGHHLEVLASGEIKQL